MEKKSFVLYSDYINYFEILSDEEAGRLIKAILNYVNTGEIDNIDNMALMAFTFIKLQLDRDTEKYRNVMEARRKSGQKGGIAAQAKARLARANQADNDNDTDNDNDNDNVTDTVNDNVSETGSSHSALLTQQEFNNQQTEIQQPANNCSMAEIRAYLDSINPFRKS